MDPPLRRGELSRAGKEAGCRKRECETMLRLAPALALAVLTGPILFGFLATVLPAFGFLPALGGGHLSLSAFRELSGEPAILRSSMLSYGAGILATAAALLVVMAFFAAWYATPLFGRMRRLVSPLLSIPHAAAAFGIAFLIAPSGWIIRLLSPELTGFTRPPDWQLINDPLGLAMLAGLVAKEIPFLFLVALAALPQARPREFLQVASGLGYGRMAGFLHVIWPALYAQIRFPVFAVIAYSTSVVDVALILGPTNPPPLAVRLVGWMNDPDLTMRFKASAGAVLQLAVTLLALLTWLLVERAASRLASALAAAGNRFPRDQFARMASGAVMLLAALLVMAGILVLAIWSVAGFWAFPDALPAALSSATWERQLPSIARPFAITLSIGLAATVIATALALAWLERDARQTASTPGGMTNLVYLPLVVPQPAFVFGLQLFFLATGLNASAAALVLVHLVFVLPYVLLSLSDPWRAWDHRYAMAALSMGVSPDRIFWRIRAPMLLPAILVASAIGFAVSVGQYLPTLLIGAGRWPTLATEAVALASGGDRRVIGVYALLQMLLPFAGFLIATLVPALVFARWRALRFSR